MPIDYDSEEFKEFESDPLIQAAVDAYRNSETAEDKLAINKLITGVDTKQAILNLCSNAGEYTVRQALASLIISLLDKDKDLAVLTMETIAKVDYLVQGGFPPEEFKERFND